MFVDRVRVNLRGGDGGAGVSSFRKQKGRPRGKPEGGDGGRGGNVILRATSEAASLLAYRRVPHWRAGDGVHGEGDLRHGRSGDDLVLPVPLGTIVRDEEGTLVADLVEEGQEIVAGHGGRGGRGNASFVSKQHRAPSFAEQGEYGSDEWIVLELKLVADAALIGYPNAGKSTLISRVSAAKPKVADYPFTTLEPNLGVVAIDDREFVFADIPGLIEGAAEGKGLGHEFLRHTERARALVVLLDPSPLQTDSVERQLEVLLSELEKHSADLMTRPRVVALNKTDSIDDTDAHLGWVEAQGLEVFPISAITGEGTEPLLHAIADAVSTAEREAPEREGYVLHRPLRSGFEIHRDGDEWVVEGLSAERAINLQDLTVPEAADFAARRLTRAGVDSALREAGAVPGDDVRIGELVFTFAAEELEELADDTGEEE